MLFKTLFTLVTSLLNCLSSRLTVRIHSQYSCCLRTVLSLIAILFAFTVNAQETDNSYYEDDSSNYEYVADEHIYDDIPNENVPKHSLLGEHSSTGANILGIVSMAGLVAMLIWSIIKLVKSGKKLTPGEIMSSDTRVKLEIFASISTLTEVLSLAIIDAEKGNNLFVAINRYSGWGILELMMTFVLMYITEKTIQNSVFAPISNRPAEHEYEYDAATQTLIVKNRNTRYAHAALGFVLSKVVFILLFLPLSLPTVSIYYLYMESIGQMHMVFTMPTHYYDILNTITIIPGAAPGAEQGIPSIAAVGFILINPLINIFQVFLVYFEHLGEAFKKYKENLVELREELILNNGIVPSATAAPTIQPVTVPPIVPTAGMTDEEIVESAQRLLAPTAPQGMFWRNFQSRLGKLVPPVNGVTADPSLTNAADIERREKMTIAIILGTATHASSLEGLKGVEFIDKEIDNATKLSSQLAKDQAAKELEESREIDVTKKAAIKAEIVKIEREKKVADTTTVNWQNKRKALVEALRRKIGNLDGTV